MSEAINQVYEFGPFRLDAVRRVLWRGTELVALTPKAFDTLLVLVRHHGQVLERRELMQLVWPDSFVEEANLSVNISALRKALGESAGQHQYIVTIPGRGYNFVAEVRESTGSVPVATARVDERQVMRDGSGASFPPYPANGGAPVTVDEPARASQPAAPPARDGWAAWLKRRRAWAFGALALISGVAAYLFWWPAAPPPPPMSIVPFTNFANNETEPAFSPNGNQVAFVWDGDAGNNNDIYVRLTSADPPLRLTTFPGHDVSPAWSPDGTRLAFIRVLHEDRAIYIASALGTSEKRLMAIASGILHLGLSWSPDGKYLAYADQDGEGAPHGIRLVAVDTLETRRLTAPPDSFGDSRPAFSPDGKVLAFVRQTTYGTDIYLQPLAGGEARRLTADNRKVEGFAWAADGRAIVYSSNRDGNHRLWRIPARGGTPERLDTGAGNAYFPTISLRGNRLAYMQDYVDANIWRVERPGGGGQLNPPTRLIASSQSEGSPVYSSDGARIAFESDRSGTAEIWLCDSEGGNPVLAPSAGSVSPGDARWSFDDRRLAFDCRPEGHRDIYVVDAAGGRPRRLTGEDSSEVVPGWSRDGRWLYFSSDRAGRWNIWKMSAEGGPQTQLTHNGGYTSWESPDGRFLYYAKFDEPGLFRMPVEGGEETRVLDGPAQGDWNRWGLTEAGIYFFKRNEPAAPTIEFFDFATRRLTPVAVLDKKLRYRNGFAVSPDGRYVLYTQVDYRRKDLLMVENFRQEGL